MNTQSNKDTDSWQWWSFLGDSGVVGVVLGQCLVLEGGGVSKKGGRLFERML